MKEDLYCPEQIEIPDNFPVILKEFVKSAIRTQPFDLLRWSAEYFRSLANNEKPMVKLRYEKETKKGTLTVGILRLLVEKIGRGYFINRHVLINKWRAITLPEKELFQHLSLCRMLKWAQVHWLKVLAVMAGSLNNNLMDTMTMICQLLSDDLEGGQARIPVWIFCTIYEYLAKLDCTVEQKFVDGRRVLPNGDLEKEPTIDELPYILSTRTLKTAILKEYIDSYNVEQVPSSTNNADKNVGAVHTIIRGKGSNIQNALNKMEKFNTLILYIREKEEIGIMEDFEGPFAINENTMKEVLFREQAVVADRLRQTLANVKNIQEKIYQDQSNILGDIGPPWSWIYQFVTDNCIEKSYNLIDDVSILSDKTPPSSSDESFDFVHMKPLALKEDVSVMSSIGVSESDAEPEEIKNILMPDTMCFEAYCPKIKEVLKEAESNGKLDVKNKTSIVSVLCKEELQILERAGEKTKTPTFNISIVLNVLRNMQVDENEFETIDDVIEYMIKTYNEIYAKFITNNDESEVISSASTTTVELTEEEIEPTEDQEALMEKLYGAGEMGPMTLVEQKCQEDKVVEHFAEEVAKAQTIHRAPMETQFEESGLVGEAAALSASIPKEMILGLQPAPPRPPTPEPPITSSELSVTDGERSMLGYRSDDSSIFGINKMEKKQKVYDCRAIDSVETVCADESLYTKCTIPIMPGIGGTVSEKTISLFLKYMKFRAMQQGGLVSPFNFREDKCPPMTDNK